MKLKGKTALITGAGSGIGKAAAILFAREGAKIAALDLSETDVSETISEINRSDGEAIGFAADISKIEGLQRAVDKTVKAFGRIDVVFANAGINGVWAPLEELEPEEWDKTIAINLRGTFLTVKYTVPFLKKQGGSIIITSSINGNQVFSNTGATAYACSKAAQVAFAKMTALELAKHHIRVNVICPGFIETNIDKNTEKRDLEQIKEPIEFPESDIPLTGGQGGKPAEVAELVLFLASDAAAYITGAEIVVDGATSLLRG